MEEIIAPAYKAKDGRIYISRFAHMEIVQLFKEIDDKDIHKESIQGFITSYDRFVDRKEALEIAKKNNKNLKKICPSDELYSEDLFLNEQKMIVQIEGLQKAIDLMAEDIIDSGIYDDKCQMKIDSDECGDICEKCIKQYYFKKARGKLNGNT